MKRKDTNNKNNHFDRKPEYWESMTKKQRGLFSVMPLISPILIIAVCLAAYYYLILVNNYFPDYQTYIYWGVKIIIGFEVLAMSARTLWGPILSLCAGIALLIAEKMIDLPYFTSADAYELCIIAGIGFLVTIVVKL